jgi:glycosyltransferase involved in cell wall biosynthesis
VSDHFVSVVLPVHKQSDHIATIVSDFTTALRNAGVRFELLLIVNGCPPTDTTRDVCATIAEGDSSIRVFEEKLGGWGRAVKRGIREATGDLICYTNSARTTDRDLLISVLYAQGFPESIVKANRRIRESAARRIGSLLYNIECRTLFDLSVWDINGTPKIFPRKYAPLLELTADGDLIDAEFNVVCREHEYPMIEVPIFSSRRHGGKSTTNYSSALNMYVGAFRLYQRRRTGSK